MDANGVDKGMEKVERPKVLYGRTHKIVTGCGNEYLIMNRDPKTAKLIEAFNILGKTGGCAAAQLEAIGRLVSRMLRNGFSTESLIKDLRGIRCHCPNYDKGIEVLSCADAIGQILQLELEWEKTDAFNEWWKATTGEDVPDIIAPVEFSDMEHKHEGCPPEGNNTDSTGGGQGEEVRAGCAGSGENPELPDAGLPVAKRRPQKPAKSSRGKYTTKGKSKR